MIAYGTRRDGGFYLNTIRSPHPSLIRHGQP